MDNVVNEIDSESLHRRLEAGEELLLVDIRTPGEVTGGAIPGARMLPMHLLPLQLQELPQDRDLVLYCRSGARSYQSSAYLKQQGWGRVLNLRGGIIDWARHGYEIAPPGP